GGAPEIVDTTHLVGGVKGCAKFVYFTEIDAGKLFRTDGTVGGTKLLASGIGDEFIPIDAGTSLFNRVYLWDATRFWCVKGDKVTAINANADDNIYTQIGNYLYWSEGGFDGGEVLWRSDGSAQGTVKIT